MAKVNIVICDLCKSLNLNDLEHSLTLSGREEEACICEKCFTTLTLKLDKSFDISRLSVLQGELALNDDVIVNKKVISDGETIVPSRVDNIKPLPEKQVCTHSKTSFEPPSTVTCHDCNESWET